MIYILRLKNECWYVGYAENVSKRVRQHVEGKGSSWTQLNPVEDVQWIMEGTKETEREVTFDLMKLYGFNKVRGAGFSVAYYPDEYPTPALDAHSPVHFLTKF